MENVCSRRTWRFLLHGSAPNKPKLFITITMRSWHKLVFQTFNLILIFVKLRIWFLPSSSDGFVDRNWICSWTHYLEPKLLWGTAYGLQSVAYGHCRKWIPGYCILFIIIILYRIFINIWQCISSSFRGSANYCQSEPIIGYHISLVPQIISFHYFTYRTKSTHLYTYILYVTYIHTFDQCSVPSHGYNTQFAYRVIKSKL